MRKEWYKYTIFISSTFKDMDAERDVIKFDVISKLNWHYRQKHLQFQAIDLRIGINTENISESESENMVLDVCLENIEKSRPFFIALLGDRYGWVPTERRWEEIVGRLSAEKRRLLAGSRHCSVTEMEILYGAIGGDGENLNHSLFFFRSKDSYEGMPAEIRSSFIDDADDWRSSVNVVPSNREEVLKQRILKLTWENDMEESCVDYKLKWNSATNSFGDTDSFADIVFERLCREIDKEIAVNEPIQQWQLQEAKSAEVHAFSLGDGKVSFPVVEETTERLVEGGAQILFTGAHGCGKSVALSQVYKSLQRQEIIFCLIAFVGTTDRSHRMSDILRRWIFELEKRLSLTITDDDALLSLTTDALAVRLTSLTNIATGKGLQVVFMVDGIERFHHTDSRDVYLTWLPDNASFLGTTAFDERLVTVHHRRMILSDLAPQSAMVLPQIIKSCEQRLNIALPEVVRRDMILVRWHPVSVSLLMRVYANFSADDFLTIRNAEAQSEIQKINSYMQKIFQDVCQKDITGLFHFAVTFVIRRINAGEPLVRALQYIALSRGGLSEQELQQLIGDCWDVLRFHKLMTIFSDCFLEDANSYRWNYSSSQLRAAFMPGKAERKALYNDIARLLLTYDDGHPQKRALLFYCLIEAEEPQCGRELLTDRNSAGCHWWDTSINFLVEDKDVLTHISHLCNHYDSRERAAFAYSFYDALPLATQLPLLCGIETEILTTIPPDDLDASHSYGMGVYYGYLFGRHQTEYSALKLPQGDLRKAPYYLERSISFYQQCYRLDPDYADVRNMLRTMMSQMLPIIAKEGNFDQVEAYNEQIEQIK